MKTNLSTHLRILLTVICIIFTAVAAEARPDAENDILTVTSFQSFENIHAGNQLKFALKIDLEENWHVNSHNPNEDYLIPTAVQIPAEAQFTLEAVNYPEPKEYTFIFSEHPVSVFEGTFYITGLIRSAKDLKEGTYTVPIALTYQACHEATCTAPTTRTETLTVKVVDRRTEIHEIHAELFSQFGMTYSTPPQPASTDLSQRLESAGLLLSLILVFFGGLALNLTPCVYPVIPITISYFGGQSEGRTRRLFLLGLLYVAGMAVTYSVIGVATAMSGAVFGGLMQQPLVIVFIAGVFILLSLSMFGFYDVKLPDSWVARAGGARTGALGALFMGLTMGIVAAPCIGPFVLGLLTYVAAKGDPFYGFVMFFFLSLGLGMPYLFLALFSGKIKQLPKAGLWMEAVKHIFGLILLGMAFYFIRPLLPGAVSGYLLPAFGICAALYMLLLDKTANDVKGFRYIKMALAFLVIAASVSALVPHEKISPRWQAFSMAKYEQAMENHEKMVIIFHADWCIPCKELDEWTFSDADVIHELDAYRVFRVDMTHAMTERAEKIRDMFDIVGMPTIIVTDAAGQTVEKITGFIGAGAFEAILSNVSDNSDD